MTIIRIDHDIQYSQYDESFIKEYIKKIPYTILSIHKRESTGGNTHIKIEIAEDVSPLDTLMIRAVLHDDSRRIRGDLERYLLDSPVFGLLFDEKYYLSTGEIKRCGEWIKI